MMACCALLACSIFWAGRKRMTNRAAVELVEEEDVEMMGTL